METLAAEKSAAAFREAQQYIPGGVNSPARAFGAVGGGPRFFERGKGLASGISTGMNTLTMCALGGH